MTPIDATSPRFSTRLCGLQPLRTTHRGIAWLPLAAWLVRPAVHAARLPGPFPRGASGASGALARALRLHDRVEASQTKPRLLAVASVSENPRAESALALLQIQAAASQTDIGKQ